MAASPDGASTRWTRKARPRPFFDPEDKYIWSLAVDAAGNVYAGTGEKGVIYKIAPDGKGAVFYQHEGDTASLSLALDRAGNLLAGTESPGRVFRIDRDGKAFVLLDSPYREIQPAARGRRRARSTRPPSTAEGRPGSPGGGGFATRAVEAAAPVPSVSTEITSISIVDVGAAWATSRVTPRARIAARPKGAVYRIAPDGLWDIGLGIARTTSPYDVAAGRRGRRCSSATGNKGKIFRLAGDPPRVTLVGRADAQQVTRFLHGRAGETYFASPRTPASCSGSRPGARRAARTTRRCAMPIRSRRWGTISWRATTPAGASVELRTRSGNTETPDETWSAWSAPYRTRRASRSRARKRATCSGARPSRPRTASPRPHVGDGRLPAAQPPAQGHLDHGPPAGNRLPEAVLDGRDRDCRVRGGLARHAARRPQPLGAGTPTAAPGRGRRSAAAPTRRVFRRFRGRPRTTTTTSSQYDVLYRREGDTAWKTSQARRDRPLFVWDTTSVPNGTYLVKIVASDAPSNPPGSALTGEPTARRSTWTTRRRHPGHRHAVAKGGATIVSLRGPGRPLGCSAGGLARRRQPLAAHLPEGRDLRLAGSSSSSSRWKANPSNVRHPRDRRHEQRGHGAGNEATGKAPTAPRR